MQSEKIGKNFSKS